jgi:predicted metal-binding membrane protein
MSSDGFNFPALDRSGRAAGRLSARPALAVWIVLAAAVALAWIGLATLALRAVETRPPGESLAGDGLLGGLASLPLPAFMDSFVALCLNPVTAAGSTPGQFLLTTAMWFLMAVAMMLPSAAPMVKTYCEIADTAAAKGESAVHPLVLVAGYLSVWLAAAVGFALLDLVFRSVFSAAPFASVSPWIAAALLAIAGLYQFSALKEACLKKCRMPFPILFSRWSTKPAAIFRLGVDEGVWCFGCCWALMLVMFAVGTMNLFWMVLLALFAVVEKQVPGRQVGRLAGTILLVWAGALLFTGA